MHYLVFLRLRSNDNQIDKQTVTFLGRQRVVGVIAINNTSLFVNSALIGIDSLLMSKKCFAAENAAVYANKLAEL